MLIILLWIIILILCLAVLIKSSDFFTDAAKKTGVILGVSPFIVGVTIVALGTSLPELSSAIWSVLKGSSEIVAGNVVGSNIANILLIIGIAALVSKKMRVKFDLTETDLPFLTGTTFLVGMMLLDRKFSLGDAIICLAVYSFYLVYLGSKRKKELTQTAEKEIKWSVPLLLPIILILSGLGIYFGSKYTIVAVIRLSELLNIGSDVIAISVIALGTSLPELAVTVAAARKNHPEIAFGNIIGSNIFNILVVFGIPGLISDLRISDQIIQFGLPMLIGTTILFYFFSENREINKWEGGMFLLIYVFFILKITGII
ncbi:sodium:calcium antiporter [Candidatus Woesearchaeota archaeon]|nr:MAG: sodium:calcium antiporter [Candidatus Woesearchaeota archaeon]